MSDSFLHAVIGPQRRTIVAGFGLNVASIAQAVDLAIEHAAHGKGFTFHTLNLDHVAKLRDSAAFRKTEDVAATRFGQRRDIGGSDRRVASALEEVRYVAQFFGGGIHVQAAGA
jgi:hypothetical protein